jgi:hypothetical protein
MCAPKTSFETSQSVSPVLVLVVVPVLALVLAPEPAPVLAPEPVSARMFGRGTWQPKYNGTGTTLTTPRHPSHRGRAGRFQLPGGPSEANTPTCVGVSTR